MDYYRGDMCGMVRDLYADMIKKQDAEEKIEYILHEKISELLSDYEEQMSNQEYKKMLENVYLAAIMAEETGFKKGFKYAFRLFTECIA